jgi:hypothetical protein
LRTQIEPSYGPQPAVAYVHPQFHEESRRSCRLGVELGQINDIRCSVKDNVSKRWTVPLALSPHIQLTVLPVFPPPTHPKVRNDDSYGPQMTVSLNLPRFHR